MDTFIIQVDCRPRDCGGQPQLGITVEAPYSSTYRQQAAKEYSNHDYQNCHVSADGSLKHNNSKPQNGTTSENPSILHPISIGEQIQRGLLITHIQKNSVIDLNGQFKIGDIIVEVNGVNLQSTFREAQKTLKEFVVKQSSHGPLHLKVLRKASSSSSIPTTTGSQATVIERNELIQNSSPNSPSSTDYTNSNTRKKMIKRIKLTKSHDGFGIKIAERDNMFGSNRPIYITAITTTGSAYRDGRLKEGDILIEVKGMDLTGRSQTEVTKILKGLAVNEEVEFVISRPNSEDTVKTPENGTNDDSKSLIDLDCDIDMPIVDGPGTYIYDIPLNDSQSAGLGLYLKYPSLDGKDLGIWIEKVITGGAAWKDGRLQPNDQILAINGLKLSGLSNAEASETLTAAVSRGIGPEATSDTIRLTILRRDRSVDQADMPTNGKHVRSQNSSGSSESSNQISTMSPQTQASSSPKQTNSSSDRTNDTSSAISQITDFTTVHYDNQAACTLPKTSYLEEHSWDDESIDIAATGEEQFKRDGFGRQSISEKRHAQLMASTTETFRRNQKLREEREKQKKREEMEEQERREREKQIHINEQLEPIHLDHYVYRAARNRSFRAAVDRSYENGFNEPTQGDFRFPTNTQSLYHSPFMSEQLVRTGFYPVQHPTYNHNNPNYVYINNNFQPNPQPHQYPNPQPYSHPANHHYLQNHNHLHAQTQPHAYPHTQTLPHSQPHTHPHPQSHLQYHNHNQHLELNDQSREVPVDLDGADGTRRKNQLQQQHPTFSRKKLTRSFRWLKKQFAKSQ